MLFLSVFLHKACKHILRIEIAGNGKLTIYGENDGAELSYSNLTVNGGDVTISGGSSGASDPTEKITVNAGSLTIKSEHLAFWAPHEFEVVLGAGITGIASESYDGSNPIAFDIDDDGDYKYVRFAKAKEYTVTFDTDGGSAVDPQTVTEGSKASKPADPTRSGYTFKGWTLGGAAYDFTDAVTGDIKLKAVWEKKVDIWVGGVGAPCCVKQVNHLVVADDPIEELYLYNGWEHEDKETGYMNRPCCAFITTKDGQIFEAYEPVTLEGFADAYSDPIVAVEISMDRGATWTTYPTENTNDNIWTHWTYTFTPQEGAYVLMARAVTASGRVSETPDTLLINAQ